MVRITYQNNKIETSITKHLSPENIKINVTLTGNKLSKLKDHNESGSNSYLGKYDSNVTSVNFEILSNGICGITKKWKLAEVLLTSENKSICWRVIKKKSNQEQSLLL